LETGISLHSQKKHELAKEAKQYSLDAVSISSTKCRGSNNVKLDSGWKLFCSGVESAQFAQAGVGILVIPQLAYCVDEMDPTMKKGLHAEVEVVGLCCAVLRCDNICA